MRLSCPVQSSPVVRVMARPGLSLVGCDCAECSNSCGPAGVRLSVNAIRTFLIQELLTHFSHMIPPTKEVDVITIPVWLLHHQTLDLAVCSRCLLTFKTMQNYLKSISLSLWRCHQHKETHERKTEVIEGIFTTTLKFRQKFRSCVDHVSFETHH